MHYFSRGEYAIITGAVIESPFCIGDRVRIGCRDGSGYYVAGDEGHHDPYEDYYVPGDCLAPVQEGE